MSTVQPSRIPVWYWIVAVLAVLWNAAGVWAYIAQVTLSPEALAAMSEAERTLYADTPAWATAAFALAVFGGLLGSVALLLRRAWALPVLVLSLIAVLVQMGQAFAMTDVLEVRGNQAVIGPLAVIVISILLVWLALAGRRKGWLR